MNTGEQGRRGPSIRFTPRRIEAGGEAVQTLIVKGYPHDVHAGWIDPLLTYPGRLDLAIHVEPVPAQLAAHQLRRRRARLESALNLERGKGRLEDLQRTAAADDAADLAAQVAAGESRLYRVALYITVRAPDTEELDLEVQRITALTASLLVDLAPATFRSDRAFLSTLPTGIDRLRTSRTMDTAAVAALMPFASPDLPITVSDTAVVYGENLYSGGLVTWDRFGGRLDNSNSVILARSGAGKSYLAKVELLRSLYSGIQVSVIDPTDEYAALASVVGGTRIRLGHDGRLNPFDLPRTKDPQAFTNRSLFFQTLVSTMVGALDATETAALDRAVRRTYGQRGITADPATWRRTPPILADLVLTLERLGESAEESASASLAERLAPYTEGSHRGLFDGRSTAALDGHLTVISLRHLPDELQTVGLLVALDSMWNRVRDARERCPRLITIDEGWSLLNDPVGARYVANFAKNARRHRAGLTLITQDVADLLSTDLGRSVAANAATQLLLRQAPQNLDDVCRLFHLSAGERQIVATAERGAALLTSGHERAAFRAITSPLEHRLITTDPVELAHLEGEG